MSGTVERGHFPEWKGGLSVFELEERYSGVFGTDSKYVMEGRWRELWALKTRRAEPEDLSGILPVQLGSFTEPFNRAWFVGRTGRAVSRVGEVAIHPDIPYMRAHLDGVTTSEKGGLLCYWDAKHVGKLDDNTIKRYTPQMTHNALIIGAEWWCISFLVGNSKWDFVEQEVDPFYAADLLAKEAEFWGYVTRDEEPEDGAALPPPKPVRLREVSLRPGDAWPNWGAAIVNLLHEYGHVFVPWTRGNILRAEMKELLPEDVGLVTCPYGKVTRNRAGAITISVTKG